MRRSVATLVLFAVSAGFFVPGRAESPSGKATAPVSAPAPASERTEEGTPRFVPPEQKILGADKAIPAGRLVRLRISPVEKTPEWLASSAYHWKLWEYDPEKRLLVELDDLVSLPDGGVFFGAGVTARRIKALCVCTHLFIVKEAGKGVSAVGTRTVLLTADVTIEGTDPPKPPPDPKPPNPVPPDPDDGDDLPEGRWGLAKVAFFAAKDAVSDAKTRREGCKALARSHRGTAAAIAAGTIKDLKTALVESRKSNNSALRDAGQTLSDWNAFGEKIQDAVWKLHESGKLKTADDYRDACVEIATGLEKIR